MTKPCVKVIKYGISIVHLRRNFRPREMYGELSAYIAGKRRVYNARASSCDRMSEL